MREMAQDFARILVPRILIALILSMGVAGACTYAAAETGSTASMSGSDAFTTPREALLREKPSRDARVLAKLPQGSRLTVIEARDRYLRVEGKGLPTGWIAREVAVVFPQDANATRELVIIGRAFSDNDTHRLLAACLLDRAAQRLRDAKTPDPEVEVLLGETAEELAVTGGPFRAELGLSEKSDATGTRGFYDAAAFKRAVDLLGGTITVEQKARAGSSPGRPPAGPVPRAAVLARRARAGVERVARASRNLGRARGPALGRRSRRRSLSRNRPIPSRPRQARGPREARNARPRGQRPRAGSVAGHAGRPPARVPGGHPPRHARRRLALVSTGGQDRQRRAGTCGAHRRKARRSDAHSRDPRRRDPRGRCRAKPPSRFCPCRARCASPPTAAPSPGSKSRDRRSSCPS